MGQFDKAIADYNSALKIDSKDLTPLWNRIAARIEQRRYDKAIKDLTLILWREPQNPHALEKRALLHAACPDPESRDGKQAVTDATRLCELSNWQHAEGLNVLAAAYAESGNFRKAVEFQTKAIELAGDETARAKFEANLKLYKHRQPYRLHPDEEVQILPTSGEKEDEEPSIK
jgi:tetratricopeptide (TPR) repeat protein